jgi:cellulose synthase/poly-beta-1,6-N-acetylglucosamine synthase-like glycosyltransferase
VKIASTLATLAALAALPVVAASGYLFVLTVRSSRSGSPAYRAPGARFAIVVPAHDEAAGIAATVESVLAVDYPLDRFEVIVVADNCTDDTAARASAAGAKVLERVDAGRRGKGFALAHAFERIVAERKADAVVVVDADTIVSPNLLRAFDARIAAGAGAVQADYAVRNPDSGWRPRLMAIALGMFHVVRSTGRENLGVSCGLRGNGMCFTTALLAEVPHDAYSVVEDVEYGIRLGERGHRVHYAGEAHVYGEMVSSEKASRSQRERWERGRRQLVKDHGFRLLRRAVATRSLLLFDLAMDLLVPPLSTLVAATVAGAAASTALAVVTGRPNVAQVLFGVSGVFLVAYGVRGWQVSGTGARGVATLGYLPFYMAWKATLPLRHMWNAKRQTRPADGSAGPEPGAPPEWVRTAREAQHGAKT